MFGNKKSTKFNTTKKKTYIKRNKIDIKNYKTLISLNNDYNNNLNISFNLIDGSKKIMPLNDQFFLDERNNKLSPRAILIKLNTIKHDFSAEEYIINKL